MTDLSPHAQEIAARLAKTLKWIAARQNRDGSWGRVTLDKVRWTSNIVLSLSELMDPVPNSALQRAISYLRTNEVRGHEEWFLRIPALAPHYSEQEREKDFSEFLQQLEEIALPMRVGVLVNLNDQKCRANQRALVQVIASHQVREQHGLPIFANKANINSLYALFLLKFSEDKKMRELALQAVFGTKTYGFEESNGNGLRVADSNSVTAYVGLNLLEISKLQHTLTEDLDFFVKVARGFHLNGASECAQPDTEGHQAFFSLGNIYTTSLYIRFIASLLNSEPKLRNEGSRFLISVMGRAYENPQLNRVLRGFYVLAAALIILFVESIVFGGDWRIAIVSSIPGLIVTIFAICYAIWLDRARVS